MNITITKPPIPLIWLDTWYIGNLAAALISEEKKRIEEAEYIIDTIISLTQQKKIICSKGDQGMEIEVSNNRKVVEKAREIQTRMALGISLNFYAAVENLQTQRMMKAVIEKKVTVEFPWRDIFMEDPIKVIDRKDRFIVNVHIPQSQEQIDDQIKILKSIAQDWESLRLEAQDKKRSYQETLSREFKGKVEAMVHVMANMTAKTLHNIEVSTEEYLQAADIAGSSMAWWEHFSGKKDCLKEVLSFYNSIDYTLTPSVNVGTRLLAELVSGNEKVQASDVMDIHHVATVLPYATYMLVDKRVRNRIQGSKTGLEKEYPGVILKEKDILSLLEKLGSSN